MNTTSSLPHPLTDRKREVPIRHGNTGTAPARTIGVPGGRWGAIYFLTSGLHTDEEARVGWVWTAVVAWVLLAVPAAVLLGRAIRRAEREERPPGPRRP